jgi:putative DNA primase/helicase
MAKPMPPTTPTGRRKGAKKDKSAPTSTRRRTPSAAPVPAAATPGDAPLPPSNVVDLDEARRLLQEDREEQERENRLHPLLPSIKGEPQRCAREFVEHFFVEAGVLQFRYHREVWYGFFGGLWQERSEEDVASLVHGKLEACRQMTAEGDVRPFACSRANISEMLFQLARVCAIPDVVNSPAEFIDGRWQEIEATGKIIVRNTLIDAMTLQTKSNQNTFIVNGAEWTFDANAPEPTKTLAFLKEILPDDELRQTLIEWAGCALAGDTTMQKAVILLGPPRAGKGVLLHLLTHLIGPSATASPALHSLSKQFGLESVVGKKLITISDARLSNKQDALQTVEILLRLIANDFISVDRKFKKQITTRLGVNLIMATNALPRLGDDSPAVQTRFVPIPLTQSFLGREDTGLLDRLLPELPGFALMCLRAYRELHKRGRLLEPAESRLIRQRWFLTDNPTAEWAKQKCVLDDKAKEKIETLYESYRDFCGANGEFESSASALSRKLQNIYRGQLKAVHKRDGNYILGIRLLPAKF